MRKQLMIGSAAATGIGLLMLRFRRRMDLRDKVVLITGGSRGLGLALAREFAARGSHLALCARSQEELEHARQDLARSEVTVRTFVCDVRDRGQVEKLITDVLSAFGRIDVLVNNAGTICVGPVENMALQDFRDAMDVMFWGMVYATLAVLPHFRRAGSGGVVNITSVGGKVSVPHLVPYNCAKFAAVAFSEGLRAELNKSGIRVVTIAPGLMRTGSFLNAAFKGAEPAESAWFSASASLPGFSMSVRRAARQIVRALEQGRAERILTTSANLLARFHGLFPETSLAVLGLVDRLLPAGGERATKLGRETSVLERPWMRAITYLGRRAAREHLQYSAAVGRR
jgi:short-subunit dehydrogenase